MTVISIDGGVKGADQRCGYENTTLQVCGDFDVSIAVFIDRPERFAGLSERDTQTAVLQAMRRGEFAVELVTGPREGDAEEENDADLSD